MTKLPRRLTGVLTAAISLVVLGTGLTTPAEADVQPAPLPVTWNSLTILQGGLSRTLIPGWHPAGSNDPTCKLTPARPRPVILVNFTAGAGWEWAAGSPYLHNNGFCVFTFTYGNMGLPPVWLTLGVCGNHAASAVA